MLLGVCRGFDELEAMRSAKEAGLDYFETGFDCLARYDDSRFEEGKAMLDELGLPCLAANGFIPRSMPVVGDDVDYTALSEYLDIGFERAAALGVKKIVFGSGRARSFPEGYSLGKAKEQISYFLKEYASPKAEKAGSIIVLEPLRFCESSMIHTVADGVEIARMSGASNVFVLADLYHVYGNADSISDISSFKGLVTHCHIAEPVDRAFPSEADSDEIKSIYKDFLLTMQSVGCDTCSIEARTSDFASDVAAAAKLLRSIIE